MKHQNPSTKQATLISRLFVLTCGFTSQVLHPLITPKTSSFASFLSAHIPWKPYLQEHLINVYKMTMNMTKVNINCPDNNEPFRYFQWALKANEVSFVMVWSSNVRHENSKTNKYMHYLNYKGWRLTYVCKFSYAQMPHNMFVEVPENKWTKNYLIHVTNNKRKRSSSNKFISLRNILPRRPIPLKTHFSRPACVA